VHELDYIDDYCLFNLVRIEIDAGYGA